MVCREKSHASLRYVKVVKDANSAVSGFDDEPNENIIYSISEA